MDCSTDNSRRRTERQWEIINSIPTGEELRHNWFQAEVSHTSSSSTYSGKRQSLLLLSSPASCRLCPSSAHVDKKEIWKHKSKTNTVNIGSNGKKSISWRYISLSYKTAFNLAFHGRYLLAVSKLIIFIAVNRHGKLMQQSHSEARKSSPWTAELAKYLEFNLHVTQLHLPSDEGAENRDSVIKQSTVCFEIR